jgi:hypothetical protein
MLLVVWFGLVCFDFLMMNQSHDIFCGIPVVRSLIVARQAYMESFVVFYVFHRNLMQSVH